MRHHHLRPTQGRHPARGGQTHPAASRDSCATCSSWIGKMIGYGIARAFEGNNIQASMIAAASGMLTEFIVATFLVIYRQR
jgi:hypothetical protein